MFGFKATALAAGIALAALAPQLAAAQDTAGASDEPIAISEEMIAEIAAACGSGDQAACLAAVQAAVANLSAAFPGVSLENLLGAVTAELAASSNAALATGNLGLVQAIAAATASISAVAEAAGVSASFLTSITAVAAAIAAGTPVDLQAFAEATGTTPGDTELPPDTVASPG